MTNSPVYYNSSGLVYNSAGTEVVIPTGGGTGLSSAIDASNYPITQTGLANAIAAATTGMLLINGTYTLTSQLVWPDNFTVYGNATFDCSALTGKAIILGSCFRWHGKMKAFGNATFSTGDSSYVLINCAGTHNTGAAPTYKNGPIIDELVLRDCKGQGLLLEFVQDYMIGSLDIFNCGYAGVAELSCQRGLWLKEKIDLNNPPGEAGNATNHGMGRYNGSLLEYPRTCDITIVDAVYINNPLWQGFDSHSAQRVTVHRIKTVNCLRGIFIGASKDATPNYVFGSHDITINNYNVDQQPTATETEGVLVSGAYTGSTLIEQSTRIVLNNGYVNGYGMAGNQGDGQILIDGAEVTLNQLVSNAGLVNSICVVSNAQLRLRDAILQDPHDPSVTCSHIRFAGTNSTIIIDDGCEFQRVNTGLDTNVATYSISQASGTTGNVLRLAPNTIDQSLSGKTGVHLPAFVHAYRSAGDVTVNNTVIVYNVASVDDGGDFNTSTGAFTARVNGKYGVAFDCTLQAGSALDVNLYLQKNGSGLGLTVSSGSTTKLPYSKSTVLRLNAGDYLNLLYGASGTGHTFFGTSASYNGFTIWLIEQES